MKMGSVCVLVGLVVGMVGGEIISAGESGSAYRDFVYKDRAAYESFRAGKPQATRVRDKAKYSRAVSPERKRAMQIYSEYLRLSRTLDDPENGYNQRIGKLRTHLFPTGRAWYWEWPLWSDNDNDFKYPFLQEIEVRAKKIRLECKKLVKAWDSEGFREKLGLRSLDDCYSRTFSYVYLDKEDTSVFPSPIRTNQIDYIFNQLNNVWPTNAIVTTTSQPTSSGSHEVVIHENPPPLDPPPPEIYEIDEEIDEANVERMKPWEDMTPEERHRALLEKNPEAWQALSRDLHRDLCGTDTNGVPLVKAALTCSNVVAVSTNIAVANLPPPTPVTAEKSWDEMTAQERHESIENLEVVGWDAMYESFVSGDISRIKDVVKALDAKPQEITEASRAFAYWHGYQTGQMEAATNPDTSTLSAIVAAYKIPELMSLVRKGYADGKSGAAPQYTIPTPTGIGGLLDGIPNDSADWVGGGK